MDRDPITQRYSVGYGAISVAAAVTDDVLVRRIRPLLGRLAEITGESVTLAVAKRFNLVYVDQVDPPNVMVPSWLDKPLPLHATSGGKAFLAWLGRTSGTRSCHRNCRATPRTRSPTGTGWKRSSPRSAGPGTRSARASTRSSPPVPRPRC